MGEERLTLDPATGTLGIGETQTVLVTIAPQTSGVDSSTFIPLEFGVGEDARGVPTNRANMMWTTSHQGARLYLALNLFSYTRMDALSDLKTLAHPDEPYAQTSGSFGEAQAPRNRRA